MASAVIRAIAHKFGAANIILLTCPKGKQIYEANRNVCQIVVFKKSIFEQYKTVTQLGCQLTIDLADTNASRFFRILLFKKSYAVSRLGFQKWFFVKFKPENLRLPHWVDMAFKTLRPLGIIPDQEGLDYYLPHRDQTEPNWLPDEFRQGYAVFIIGGQYATRKLPTARLIEVCSRINLPIVIIGGQADHKQADEVAQIFNPDGKVTKQMANMMLEANQRTRVFNACGLFNLNQSASLIKQSEGVFSYDTGLMHAAAAFGKTIYTIWGSTTPLLGRYPYRTKFITYQNSNLNCRPCHIKGHNKCPLGHFKCMNDIQFEFKL